MKANAIKLIVRELMSTSVNRLARQRMLGGTPTLSQHRGDTGGIGDRSEQNCLLLHYFRATCGSSSLGWDGDERQILSFARIGQSEEQHHQGKHLFGGQVGIVDPEINATIKDRDEGIRRSRLRAVNSNQTQQILSFPLCLF